MVFGWLSFKVLIYIFIWYFRNLLLTRKKCSVFHQSRHRLFSNIEIPQFHQVHIAHTKQCIMAKSCGTSKSSSQNEYQVWLSWYLLCIPNASRREGNVLRWQSHQRLKPLLGRLGAALCAEAELVSRWRGLCTICCFFILSDQADGLSASHSTFRANKTLLLDT